MQAHIIKHRLPAAIALVLCGLAVAPAAFAGSDMSQSSADNKPQTVVETLMSAAPESVAKHATVLSRTGKILKKGDSEWVCRFAGLTGDTPTCLDSQSRAYFKAR
ncbi:MAG: hypothetical protein PF483_05200, partial [Halothiobacillus sp.]|nr:hypothetical protein [Halothiobacillus sp.]